jgi:hypothetical protein
MKAEHNWARLLAYITGLVNQELLLQNEYLAAENRILRAHLPVRLRLSNPERATLAEIGKRVGRKALAQVASVAKPDTILGWYRRLVATKVDGAKYRSFRSAAYLSRSRGLIMRFARENPSLDHGCPDQPRTRRLGPDGWECSSAAWDRTGTQRKPDHDLERLHSGPHGSASGSRFLHHRSTDVERAGDVLRFILRPTAARRLTLGGVTQHPTTHRWNKWPAMRQTGRVGYSPFEYVLHDRDASFANTSIRCCDR